jgi:hypothetical protein
MCLAINSSPPRASSAPSDDTDDADDLYDNLKPSVYLDADEDAANAPSSGPLLLIVRNSGAKSNIPAFAMDIRVVKVLSETSDGDSVTYKVRMSDGFTEIVRTSSHSFPSSPLHPRLNSNLNIIYYIHRTHISSFHETSCYPFLVEKRPMRNTKTVY